MGRIIETFDSRAGTALEAVESETQRLFYFGKVGEEITPLFKFLLLRRIG